MKKSFLVSALLAVLAISGCQIKEENEFAPEGKIFTATMEAMHDDATAVYTKTVLDNSTVLWKLGDQVSIFAGSAINEQFQVTDESDGKAAASLYQVSTGSGFVAGGEISANVAFYPYASTAGIAKSGNNYVISDIALPSTQDYAEDSFGNGAYPMAAVTSSTSDNKLKFKNVLGGLKLQLKGTAAVASISVTGNNNEKLCGAASVTVSNTEVPTINLSDATATTVTLDCGDGVQLDAETATAFVIALPPMTMEGGFTVIVTGTGGSTLEVKTQREQTITRSGILKMPAVTFDEEPVVAGPKYVKVTSNDDIEEDAQYILVYESANKAFKPILASAGTSFTKSTANAIDVVISNNTISSDDLDDCLITFEDGKYLFIESAGDNGKYLYPGASGTSALGAEDKTESHTVSISIASDGIATIARTSDAAYHLYWSSSNYFSGIQQSVQNAGPQYDANICLYKLYDDRTPQSLSFSADEAEYDVFVNKWVEGKGVPGLSGAETTVTYASSNESVATVDPTSGAVTIASGAKKGDKAVITATAEKDATWRAAKASYTITIINSDPNVPVYTKVLSNDDIEAGARYLLVNESNSKVFKPILNGSSFTAAAANALDATIEDYTIVSDEFGDCELTLENGYYFFVKSAECYLYPSSSIGAEESKSDSHKFSISIASDGVATVSRTSSGSTYRLRWTSQGYFQSSTSSANSQLYKLEDGLQSQNISFSADGASYDVFAGDWEDGKGVPGLSGAQTDVTYVSSNESVATVDASTGAVTIVSGVKKGDKAVITATAEQDDSYRAATASYTISIVDSSIKTPEYVLVESTDDIEAEAKYLLVNESNSKVFKPILNGSNFTQAAANALSATIENHTIVSDEFVECELTLETGYYFFVESANRYIYPTSNSIGAEETKGSSHNLNISIASNGVATVSRASGTSYKLRWTGSGYFQSSNSSANCQLYKLQENGPKKRNLKFSASEVSVNIYGQSLPYAYAGAPTLSGKTDGVTYSVTCSDSSIATSAYPSVSASGAVTINGTGVFTIKASAPATEELQAGETSYKLTVSSVKPTTYTKTTSVSVDDTYLIVSVADDKLFNGIITTGSNAINITPVDGVITDTDNAYSAYEFTLEKDGDNYYIKFKDGKYLVCNYTSGDTGTGLLYVSSKSDVTYPYTVSTNNGAVFFNTTQANNSSNTNQYLYYKTGTSGSGPLSFKIGQSGSTVGVHLYKKN